MKDSNQNRVTICGSALPCIPHICILCCLLLWRYVLKDPEIAEAAGVMGTPTVQMFKDKARVEQVSGVKMKKDYR